MGTTGGTHLHLPLGAPGPAPGPGCVLGTAARLLASAPRAATEHNHRWLSGTSASANPWQGCLQTYGVARTHFERANVKMTFPEAYECPMGINYLNKSW